MQIYQWNIHYTENGKEEIYSVEHDEDFDTDVAVMRLANKKNTENGLIDTLHGEGGNNDVLKYYGIVIVKIERKEEIE